MVVSGFYSCLAVHSFALPVSAFRVEYLHFMIARQREREP